MDDARSLTPEETRQALTLKGWRLVSWVAHEDNGALVWAYKPEDRPYRARCLWLDYETGALRLDCTIDGRGDIVDEEGVAFLRGR